MDSTARQGGFQFRADAIEARWRPEIARLRIPSLGRSEAELLATLAAAGGARRALELGTAIGYSAAYLATAMGPEGRVTAVDLNPERAALARRLWTEAGLGERITLHEGNALDLARSLGSDYDLVFVDLLWEIRERDLGRQLARDVTAALRPGGVLVADNCGQSVPAADGLKEVTSSDAYRTMALLPLGDGVLLVSFPPSGVSLVPGDAILVAHGAAAKDIQGAAEGEVDAALAESLDEVQIGQGVRAAGVGAGDRRPAAERRDELGVDSARESLDVGGVNQELGAVLGDRGERLRTKGEVGLALPAVDGNPPAVAHPSAAQVDDEPLPPDRPRQRIQTLRREDGVGEEPTGDDDFVRAGLQPGAGVVEGDAAAELEPARPGGEHGARGVVVARTELDDVAAHQSVGAIERGEVLWRLARDEVRPQAHPRVGQASPDDLFDLPLVQVDAWAKAGHRAILSP